MATTTTGAGPRVALLHGFTQTAASWTPIAERLSADHEVVALDAPGHGGSASVRAGLWETAALIAAAVGRATYAGYSMGGRLALHVALAHPEAVERLVLVSATAGIDDPAARAERRDADATLARELEHDGLDRFLERWLAQPLFSSLPPDAATLADRRTNTVDGLAWSLRTAGTGSMDPPLWDRLGAIGAAGIPVLVVAGERDGKFRALGQRIVEGIGATARLHVVVGAGHAVPWERPDDFVAALGTHLRR
ncbi:MAG: alpha/beta fold hydrolase [Actinobacteria bacterium]|nr:alpha/beta fold hydrolase [Actinomycetota bacterium]